MSNHLRKGSLSEDSAPPLASRASEAMRLGDFKQAIDLFKRLVKQDARREWCDALAEAYAGRARSLAAKAMFEEAETALSKTAAPDGTVLDPLLYVQCLVKRGQVHKAAELAVKYVVNDKPRWEASGLSCSRRSRPGSSGRNHGQSRHVRRIGFYVLT